MTEGEIGILGGTFNPVHLGHLELARQAHLQFHIPQILLMPTASTYYKREDALLPAADRCKMLELAIQPYPYMRLSMLDLQRGGVTYTADTIDELSSRYNRIYFIVGADSLLYIDSWYKAARFLPKCVILAANRDNCPMEKLEEKRKQLCSDFHADIRFLQTTPFPFSSSEIRKRLQAGLPCQDMLPAEVLTYIVQNHLYQ